MSELAARLPDGRTLTLAGHGSPAGPVVVLLPCAPGSRLIDPDRMLAALR